MHVQELSLSGLKLVTPRVFQDGRGFFLESYREGPYKEAGISDTFVQDNHSFSTKGCIRGMHFQSHPGQAKLVRVVVGEIFDVAVDIRPNSPTFMKWEAVILNEKNHAQIYIPVGFAHGFCVLSDVAHVLYKVSSPYHPDTEKGFKWNDPSIGIEWPIKDAGVSERDEKAPYFNDLSL